MVGNRDLKEDDEEEPLRRPPLSDIGGDHARLRSHRSCSGARLPNLDDDDGAMILHGSHPAMLHDPDERERKRSFFYEKNKCEGLNEKYMSG
jgi:hypothetical protein